MQYLRVLLGEAVRAEAGAIRHGVEASGEAKASVPAGKGEERRGGRSLSLGSPAGLLRSGCVGDPVGVCSPRLLLAGTSSVVKPLPLCR